MSTSIFMTTSGERTRHALLGEWRVFLASITSFIVTGLIGVNHHAVFHAIRRLDRITLVLNLVLLLLVSFVSRIQVAAWKMMPSV